MGIIADAVCCIAERLPWFLPLNNNDSLYESVISYFSLLVTIIPYTPYIVKSIKNYHGYDKG